MNEQDQHDPLSFKGQMAARYRERLAMGFALAQRTPSNTPESSSLASSNAQRSTPEARGALARPGMHRSVGEPGLPLESQVRPRTPVSTAGRSRSTGEHQFGVNKTTMKYLISKFETRSITSDHMKQASEAAGDKHSVAKEAWDGTCPKGKTELGQGSLRCRSSSDVAESKSSTSVIKPSQQKLSRGGVSSQAEAKKQRHQQIVQPYSRPPSRISGKSNPDKYGEETSSSAVTVSRHGDIPRQQKENPEAKMQETVTESFDAANAPQVSPFTGVSWKPENTEPSSQEEQPEQTIPVAAQTTPLRVNLRSIAARRQGNAGNKYVVYTKDWGKRLVAKEQELDDTTARNCSQDTCGQEVPVRVAMEQNIVLKDVKATHPLDVPFQEGGQNKIKNISVSPQFATTPQSLSCQSERLEGKFSDEKQRTKAMERYLQFLRANNDCMQSGQVPGYKTPDRINRSKSLRPPTPHRMLNVSKKSLDHPRNIFQHFRENSLLGPSTPSLGLRQNVSPNFRDPQPETKSPMDDKKDTNLNPNESEFLARPVISSTNSVDSSVQGYPMRLESNTKLAQPKTDTFNFKMVDSTGGNKPASIWAYLSGKNTDARNLAKNPQILPFSGHEIKVIASANPQPALVIRSKSATVGKLPTPNTQLKMRSLNETSTKSSTPVSPVIENSSPQSIPVNQIFSKERQNRSPTINSSDFVSFLLTGDEIADNDLVPIHLRERNGEYTSRNVSHLLSSSDDNFIELEKTKSKTVKILQLKKDRHSSPGKVRPDSTEFRTTPGPHLADKPDIVSATRKAIPKEKAKGLRSTLHNITEEKMSADSDKVRHRRIRLQAHTPTKCTSTDHSTDDSYSHQILPNQNQLLVGKLEIYPKAMKKKTAGNYSHVDKEKKKRLNDAGNAGIVDHPVLSRLIKERKMKENSFIVPELKSMNQRGDSFISLGDGLPSKNYLTGRTLESVKESPAKKAGRHKLLGPHPSNPRKKKLEPRNDSSLLFDFTMNPRDQLTKASEIAFNFHFGHPEVREDKFSDHEKVDATSVLTQHKKRRKRSHSTKVAKKIKKTKEFEDETDQVPSTRVTPTTHKKNIVKEKSRDKEDTTAKSDREDKEISSHPGREKPVVKFSSKSHPQQNTLSEKESSVKISRKLTTRDTSSGSAISDWKSSPKLSVRSTSPDKSSPSIKWPQPAHDVPVHRPVQRLTCEPTLKFPFKSQIPILHITSVTPRNKLDRLIEYRRLREGMLNCICPSRLPLSKSFRQTLDSAVMEEWSLHCWHPSSSMYMDNQGIWWNDSYQLVEGEDGSDSTNAYAQILSPEGLLDFTARLPYLKVGPISILHASYILMAVFCVTLGHMGVRLYHCSGDEYEYYCPDDDVECLMQLL